MKIVSCLLPILQPLNSVNVHSVVIVDNASIHHVDGVTDQTGARLQFLPPYALDLNPIEEVLRQAKAIMKSNDALFQVTTMPRVLLKMAFGMVTKIIVIPTLPAQDTYHNHNNNY